MRIKKICAQENFLPIKYGIMLIKVLIFRICLSIHIRLVVLHMK